jgi:hypothetical protein
MSCTNKVFFDQTMTQWTLVCDYSQQCKILTMNACPQGFACHIGSGGIATCDTPTANVMGEGGPCMYENDCMDSQFCYQSVCRYNCFLNGMGLMPGLGGCPQNETCKSGNFGIDNIGVCLPN